MQTGWPLSPQACQSRIHPRQEDVRGPYFRDQTAIIHATPFRRLKHKAQVFFAPENDHLCTRMEHVLHVATIAATICRGLVQQGWKLDSELAYAAGLGHDLGHAPFGHAGERALEELLGGRHAFCHEDHSLRVVDHLARDGYGLNLTRGVRDAIICHNGERFDISLCPDEEDLVPEKKTGRAHIPATWEGCAVRFADKIAYLGRDVEDALTAGLIHTSDVPQEIKKELGHINGEIINMLVIDLIEHTAATGRMGLSEPKRELIHRLYTFNVERIYQHPAIVQYEHFCNRIINTLYDYLMERCENPDDRLYGILPLDTAFASYLEKMAPFYQKTHAPSSRIVIDYIAGMTDNYALTCMQQVSLPPMVFK